MKRFLGWVIVMLLGAALVAPAMAADKTIAGVTFPGEKMVDGKQVVLNGGGCYLEKPTSSAAEAINSEQVKQFYLHYLTSKATAAKLQDGFIEAIEGANPPDLVKAQEANIKRYASWLDKDMAPGKTSVTTYVPGKGLTLVFYGEEKGTITDPTFIRMYMTYIFGEKADKSLREGYLGK
jgi:hypothetical protein